MPLQLSAWLMGRAGLPRAEGAPGGRTGSFNTGTTCRPALSSGPGPQHGLVWSGVPLLGHSGNQRKSATGELFAFAGMLCRWVAVFGALLSLCLILL